MILLLIIILATKKLEEWDFGRIGDNNDGNSDGNVNDVFGGDVNDEDSGDEYGYDCSEKWSWC